MSNKNRNSQLSIASQDSIELVLNQFKFTHAIDEFELMKNSEGSSRVGDGGFGSVVRYGHEELGDVVIKKKRIRNNDDGLQLKSNFESFAREVKALQHLSHENIVKCYGTTRVSDDVVGIIMEYVDGTSLQCLLKKQGSKLPWIVRYSILYQISKALKQLHRYKKNKWLVHSDLKPGNIMITDDWKVKLIDFGSINFGKIKAASQDSLDQIKSGQKTVFYAAPEILVCDDAARTPDIDIYSYGMVIYEVLTGKEVYSDANCPREWLLEAIKNGVRPNAEELDQVQAKLSVNKRRKDLLLFSRLRALAEECWGHDPDNRPTIEKVLACLEQTLRKVADTNFDESKLYSAVEKTLEIMKFEATVRNCHESRETLSEEQYVNLIQMLESQSSLEDEIYCLIDETASCLADHAISSKSARDYRKAICLYRSLPDKSKANEGEAKCASRLAKATLQANQFPAKVRNLLDSVYVQKPPELIADKGHARSLHQPLLDEKQLEVEYINGGIVETSWVDTIFDIDCGKRISILSGFFLVWFVLAVLGNSHRTIPWELIFLPGLLFVMSIMPVLTCSWFHRCREDRLEVNHAASV